MRWLALPAALALAGCIDFKEITPPDPVRAMPAEFHAHLLVEDVPREIGGGVNRTGAYLTATLVPGRDAGGQPRSSRDDTVRISGVALAPTRVEADGARAYRGWVPLPGNGEDGILLTLSPPVVVQDARPPAVHQPVPVRVGSDSLETASDADLQLRFAIPPLPPGTQALDRRWSLHVSGDRGSLSISGEGLPSSPLVVPSVMLPASSNGRLTARLFLSSHAAGGVRGSDDYFVDVQLNASLGWTVRRRSGDAPR